MNFARRTLALAAVLAFCGPLRAQTSPGQNEPEQPIDVTPLGGHDEPPKPADPLAGPKVSPESAKRTLVAFDYNGRLRRLDVPAEEAALDLLALDPQSRAGADKILAERAAILDKIVIENLDLLIKLNTSKGTADKGDLANLFRELTDKLAPLRARGRLRDEIGAALPESSRPEFDRLVADYWQAIVKDGAKDLPEGTKPAAVLSHEVLLAVGKEVKRSFERQIAAKAAELDEFIKTLGLTGEQETRVRNILTDFYQQTRGKATSKQKREMVAKVMAELDQEQKKILIQTFLGGRAR